MSHGHPFVTYVKHIEAVRSDNHASTEMKWPFLNHWTHSWSVDLSGTIGDRDSTTNSSIELGLCP